MDNQIWFHKYRIIKLLGRGGSSEVYLAEHLNLKVLRAIKKISKDTILYEQLLQEAYILRNLSHPGIPIIYDFEEDAHNSYIIEQYIEGDSLKVYRHKYEHLPQKSIIDIAVQICDLMNYLYSLDNPILYLDLKPENIIITNEKTLSKNNLVVKLIDFGASSYKNQLYSRKYSMGTKGFAAPELYGNPILDERADVYGIGSLLCFLITGKSGDISTLKTSSKAKVKHYSKDLYRIVKQCLRTYPPLRYSKVTVLKKQLLSLSGQKSSLFLTSSNSISIAVAGSQHRIGTTHLAILLTSFFTRKGRKGLYIEKNKSNHVLAIAKRFPNLKRINGSFRLYQCYLLPEYHTKVPHNNDFQITVIDYGCLNEDNLADYLKADVKILISGGKEWELEGTEAAMKILESSQNVKYLFNYMDGRQFHEIKKYMGDLPCFRIPYIPNPFETKNNTYLDELIENLVSEN